MDDIKNESNKDLHSRLRTLHDELDSEYRKQFDRSLPLNEELTDRWRRAKRSGFGDETSVYDSSFIFGRPNIGRHCWICPYTIIDGSGGLTIGDWSTISAGVHIYSHDNVMQTLTSGLVPIQRENVTIGSNVYIGPNTVITRGVNIGNYSVIGAYSLVNKDIPSYKFVVGQPAKVIGSIVLENEEPRIILHNSKE